MLQLYTEHTFQFPRWPRIAGLWFFEQRGRATYNVKGYRILWQTWPD